MLLVALPVCGMTMITVLVRTNNDSGAELFAREFGAADLVATSGNAVPFVPGGDGGVKRVGASGGVASTLPTTTFPPGTEVVRTHDFVSGFTGLISNTGVARLAHATDLDLNDPIAHGIVLLRSGRYPTHAGEALLSPSLARAFNVHVGDTLRLRDPSWTEKVVGTGVLATNWTDGLIAVRDNELSRTGGQQIGMLELVDLPGHPTDAQLAQYSSAFQSRIDGRSQTATTKVNWVLVGGIVALAIVGIVISGAFAVGARRQLVTLGQLSSNGADEHLLRRTLSLQGLLSGAIGSVVGFSVGVVALIALQGRLASLIHHDPGPLVWSARDAVAILITGVVTATVAAFIPARSAARVPVLAALAGRRPLGRIPKSLVPTGLGLFASGVFVLALVAAASGNGNGNQLALSAVFGGVLVLSGACCASSAAVAGLGSVARRARGSMRVAVRSVVRSRARSAAVVMALAAMNAGAIAVATAIDSHTGAKAETPFMPDNTLIVSSGGDLSGNLRQFLPPPAAAIAALHRILPDATYTVRRAVVGSTDANDSFQKVPGLNGVFVPPIATVTDPEVLRMLGLSARDKAALDRYGMISVVPVMDRNGRPSETVPVELGTPARDVTAAVVHDPLRAVGDSEGFYITEGKARELGLPIQNAGVIVRNPTPFTDSQKASLLVQQAILMNNSETASTFIAWEGASSGGVSPDIAREIVLGIVIFLTLCVLAMALALSAAETRDERDILVSLGAKPSTMRAVSGWKSVALAVSGALLAIPTGFIPVWVVFHAVRRVNETAHVAFPWLTVLQLVIVAPIIAGIVAYIGSAIAQAVKPTKMSTFALD
jgi:putative ABC transport system permease protein